MNTISNTDRGYSTKEVCSIFSIHKSTAQRWVQQKLLPQPYRIGRSIRFSKQEIDDVIQNKKAERLQ